MDQDSEGCLKCCKWQLLGAFYTALGLIVLPVFLTLSTKNMFTGPYSMQASITNTGAYYDPSL